LNHFYKREGECSLLVVLGSEVNDTVVAVPIATSLQECGEEAYRTIESYSLVDGTTSVVVGSGWSRT
jgi:hypothetical protein